MRSLEVFWVSFPAENSYSRRDFLFQANLAAQMNILVPNPLIYMLSIAYFWFIYQLKDIAKRAFYKRS